jgi:DNA-binding SARP family transcriptional activator/tetratricopeptide (TPR) repeat protein
LSPEKPATRERRPTLIGRDTEIVQISGLLATSRVVTLLGPPGVGKTALAAAAADRWTGDVEIVPLGGVPAAGHVVSAIAAHVGTSEGPGRAPTDAIAARLRTQKNLLLVLDSCEVALDGVGPFVDALALAAPDVRVLATSRQPLSVSGEVTLRVSPLDPSDAIELLRSRSERAPTDAEAADMCRALDYLPLAIELAASSGTDLAGRQASGLDVALASSVANVPGPGRDVLAFVAACPAGVPSDAFPIAGLDDGEVRRLVDASLVTVDQHSATGTSRFRVIEPLRDALRHALEQRHHDVATNGRLAWCTHVVSDLTRAIGTRDEPRVIALADAEQPNVRTTLSSVFADDGSHDAGAGLVVGLARYWLVRGRLAEGDTWLQLARSKPTEHSAELAAAAGAILAARGRVGDAEASYTEAASAGRESGDALLEASGETGLGHIAFLRGDWDRSADLLDHAVSLARPSADSQVLLTALHQRATVARLRADLDTALRLSEEGLAAARRAGNRTAEALVLLQLGGIEQTRGERENAVALIEESVAAAAEVGADAVRAAGLGNLGNLAVERGDLETGRRRLSESLEITRSTGDVRTSMITLTSLAAVARRVADATGSRRYWGEAMEIARRLPDRRAEAWILNGLGEIALDADDLDGAASLFGQALAIRRGLGEKRALALTIESIAALCAKRGDHRDAARFVGAADAVREGTGVMREPNVGAEVAAVVDACSEALGPQAVESEREAGRAMSLEEATAAAEVAVGRSSVAIADVGRAPVSSARVAIKTLGGFGVFVDGEPVAATAWQSRKARDLVKILVARRGYPTPRDVLIELLWPDDPTDEGRLRARLSVVLSTVRTVFGDASSVVADRASIGLDTRSIDIDVERFLAAVASDDLEGAEALYTGEFLPEDVYSDWSVGLREEVRLAFVGTARALARARTATGDHDRVLSLAARILEQDAYDDEAHRMLVGSLASSGRHGDARRAYELFAKRMDEIGLIAPAFDALVAAP